MAQKNIQIQTQKQVQVQRLSQQQILQVKLLEMPLTELEESINSELDDNPALETGQADDVISEGDNDANEGNNSDNYDDTTEHEERQDALDSALEGIGRDDEMPETHFTNNNDNAEYEERVFGDTTSFYDKLKEQVDEMTLTARQEDIIEYLIGSLDEDGLLRKDINAISDELAIYHNIDVTTDEIVDVLHILQTFDPAGIGARNLQECLLLQIERKPNGTLKDLMYRVINDHFDEFTKKHWDKIQSQLSLNDIQTQTLNNELRKLNPKPGASLGETLGQNTQQITPDFIIDTDDNGNISFTLNRGNIPELKISSSFSDMVDTYKNNKDGMSRQEKEALLYAKSKVTKAEGYIEAIRQRQHTLRVTMKAIIDRQRKFFQDGDEADLKPMILKDIADVTGLDISTISRVSNIKYAQTRWGIFPLRFFFTDSYTTDDGETMSTRKIKIALKEFIDSENKHKPLSDDIIKDEMQKQGYPIARRTVAKYREQLGIPVARLRKQ